VSDHVGLAPLSLPRDEHGPGLTAGAARRCRISSLR
jgi:hypothetical protein